jgi:hypothetical protein
MLLVIFGQGASYDTFRDLMPTLRPINMPPSNSRK